METNANIGKNGTYFNIGHIWSENLNETLTGTEDVHEAVVGVGIKLSNRWSVRWNGIFNVGNEELQYHTGGLYYNHPCYYVSAEYRRDNARKNDYVGTTTFQFRFGMAIDGQQY